MEEKEFKKQNETAEEKTIIKEATKDMTKREKMSATLGVVIRNFINIDNMCSIAYIIL